MKIKIDGEYVVLENWMTECNGTKSQAQSIMKAIDALMIEWKRTKKIDQILNEDPQK